MDNETVIKPDEDLSILQDDSVRVIQKRNGYRFSVDSFLLADFVELEGKKIVVEFGAGCGILAILLARKFPLTRYIAIEIQAEMADRARRNVVLNAVQNIELVVADIGRVSRLFGNFLCDAVVCNPPYRKLGSGILNPVSEKAIARHEIKTSLREILKNAESVLKPGGSFTFIHLSERLAEVQKMLHVSNLKPVRMRPIKPFAGSPPNLFLMECTKGGAGELREKEPLILYDSPGNYTEEACRILKTRKPI
jgi:tRNA1Val (adenine37-N6)-methyltransferase